MSGMSVAATVRAEPDVCFSPPHGHATGNREVTRRKWLAAKETLQRQWPEGRALVAS